jgi:hypothetical protein
MCFLEIGCEQATQLVFDYTYPPAPPRPNQLYHYEKVLFNIARPTCQSCSTGRTTQVCHPPRHQLASPPGCR